jgi:alpha-amylase
MTRPFSAARLALSALLALAGLVVLPAAPAAAAYTGPRAGMVQLFEWPWADVARECTTFLGPKGYWAVQVSPPQEHARVAGDPWWERYQPVSYAVTSRSGDRAAFASMVGTCRAAGVGIIADVVLNHMTGTDGTSITGRAYTKYHYPAYGPQDFHQPACSVTNYADRGNVQGCELVGLADLRTDSAYVRGQEQAYLNDLMSLGVLGFRVDAAKHIPAADLAAVLAGVPGNPYVFSEVIDYGGEAVGAGEYTGLGDVTEFRYGARLATTMRGGRLADLVHPERSWSTWGVLASADAVPFVANHDTERGQAGGGVLTYKDGSLYNLAQVYTLAWPYGNPVLTSGYAWTDKDAGPPGNGSGGTSGPWRPGDTSAPSGCANITPWVCEHRWGNVAAMVGFRAATTAAWSVGNVWDNGFQQVAFSRGSLGFVAINRESFGMDQWLPTGMPAGTYCQVLSGDFDLATRACAGSTVTVQADGRVHVVLPGMAAFAIHAGSRLG